MVLRRNHRKPETRDRTKPECMLRERIMH